MRDRLYPIQDVGVLSLNVTHEALRQAGECSPVVDGSIERNRSENRRVGKYAKSEQLGIVRGLAGRA